MIRRLKRKLILLSASALFLLLTIIVVGMNLINYSSVVAEADDTLYFLSQNKGDFPQLDGEGGHKIPPHFSPETPYESRYFSVLFTKEEDVLRTDTGRISSVTAEDAVKYARQALGLSVNRGFIGNYRFLKYSDAETVSVTFLDCRRQLDIFRDFLISSALISLLGFVAVAFILFVLAGRIVRPIAESYEKQKRFITDAGHEIKTPLTVISANAELLEMEIGESESLIDIQKQTRRLAELTHDLVELSRMEEGERSSMTVDFPISDIVSETAALFKAPLTAKSCEYEVSVQEGLNCHGDSKAIERLLSILLDNALKYSNEGGRVELSLSRQGGNTVLSVFNTTGAEIDKASLERVFDRFYRGDSSRNSVVGGYGIGLSLARAIVTAHGGRITAQCDEKRGFGITVLL